MMKKPTPKFSPEVRSRAVRMFHEHKNEHASPWEAMQSIASKIGCSGQTLRSWVRQDERDRGPGGAMASADRERLKELERENRELLLAVV